MNEVQRSDLIRHQQTKAWNIPVLRVQLPGSYPIEYQWQFDCSDEWTEEEMTPIEEALLVHISNQANATWMFYKAEDGIDITRPNWRYTVTKQTPQEVAEYIHDFYRRTAQ